MSYAYVLPGERSSSGAAKRWLLAYPLAQLLCLGGAAAAVFLARGLQWPDGSYETLALSAITAVIYGLAFGYLRGSVLREKLARFSMLWWCAAITAISFFFLPPEPEALGLSGALNLQASVRAALPVLLSGFVYGLAIGTAEALTLRRAAFGLFGWALMSGFAWGLGHIAASAFAGLLMAPQMTAFQTGSLHVACMVLQATLAGLVMLPALRLITPRLRHYGPRVYRPAVRARG
jgi:hypothetical protein